MRLPKVLLTATVLAIGTSLSFAADMREPSGSAPTTNMQTLRGVDDAMVIPQFFIPPHGMQRGQFHAMPQSPNPLDSVCYNIHSLVVTEDDHTGVVHKVRESTCTRASRFQTKDAEAPPEK